MDMQLLNQKWFAVLKRYCQSTFLCNDNTINDQVNRLYFKKFRIGVLLPFEKSTLYFRYCFPEEEQIDGKSLLETPMLIVLDDSGINDENIPTAIGIYESIMLPNPIAWAPFQTERKEKCRKIDLKIADLERKLFQSKDEKGIYILPIIYGTFPLFVFLLSSPKNLIETFDAPFLRSVFEYIVSIAGKQVENDLEDKLLKPLGFEMKDVCNDYLSFGKDVTNALFYHEKRKYSSWIISLPGHYLDEMPARKREETQAKERILAFFEGYTAGEDKHIVSAFKNISRSKEIENLFLNICHSPWELNDKTLVNAQNIFKSRLQNLSKISNYLKTIIDQFVKCKIANYKAKVILSQLKAYLWMKKERNSNIWLIPFGLILDWPEIVSGNEWPNLDKSIVCLSGKKCTKCSSANCQINKDNDHSVCHFNDRFRISADPYDWVETLRKLIFSELLKSNEKLKVTIALEHNLNSNKNKQHSNCTIRIDNISVDPKELISVQRGSTSSLIHELANSLNVQQNTDPLSQENNNISFCNNQINNLKIIITREIFK